MYINVESLCCTLETNIIFYVNYTSVFLNLKKEVLVDIFQKYWKETKP